jgi:hypothetical protein
MNSMTAICEQHLIEVFLNITNAIKLYLTMSVIGMKQKGISQSFPL